MPNPWTVLNNPTLGYTTNNTSNPFPGWAGAGAAQLGGHDAGVQRGQRRTTSSSPSTAAGCTRSTGRGSARRATDPVTITYGNYANVNVAVPLSTYGNFRYNTPILAATSSALSGPNAVGMDEDYDACDLENWFLAIQSADGQVMIPSFHRPGVVRYQDTRDRRQVRLGRRRFRYPNGMTNAPNLDSLARILRPVAADGHDAATFPDLVPIRAPARSPMTSTTTATGSPTRSGSTSAIRPAATPPATSTSRCSPSWSSA